MLLKTLQFQRSREERVLIKNKDEDETIFINAMLEELQDPITRNPTNN